MWEAIFMLMFNLHVNLLTVSSALIVILLLDFLQSSILTKSCFIRSNNYSYRKPNNVSVNYCYRSCQGQDS